MTSSQCCGLHVKTCAMIVAVLGLIGSCGSLVLSALARNWLTLPISIVMVATYIFVIIGVDKERPSFLMPAQIIFAFILVPTFILILAYIILGIVLPENLIQYLKADDTTYEDAKIYARVLIFFVAFIYFLNAVYTIFAFTVIHRTRKYLLYI